MNEGKLAVKSTAFAGGVLWGVAVLMVGLTNYFLPGYGDAFLDLLASIYPGYDALPTIGSVLIGTAWAVVDGAIAGLLFAVLYNFCACCKFCKKQ